MLQIVYLARKFLIPDKLLRSYSSDEREIIKPHCDFIFINESVHLLYDEDCNCFIVNTVARTR